MTPEQVDRLIDLVVTIGGKAATEGFAIAMRRVTYLAVADLAMAAFITILCCSALYFAQLCWRKHVECKEDTYYDNDWATGCWALRVLAILVFVVAVPALLISGFDKLLNPEWHAIQMLLGLL
jgi:hypothetical protein